MENKKSKTLILNTLILVFCVGIIALFCFIPVNEIKVLEKYDVVFDSNGGSAIAAITIEEGKVIQPPETPVREGYIFVGWMLGDDLYDFSTSVTGNVTLKAKWEERKPDVNYFTITFLTGDGSPVTPIIVEEGQVANAPIPPVREGYTFVEWQFEGTPYTFTEPVTEDMLLDAVWLEVTPQEPEEPEPGVTKYNVIFTSNGRAFKTFAVEEGKTSPNPGTPAAPAGYSFGGWFDGANQFNFNTPITSNKTISAKWNEIPKKNYTVDFIISGNICGTVTVVEGTVAGLPASCSPKDNLPYKFVGWSTASGATSANFVPGSTVVNSNTYVYAAYQEITYSVSCALDGQYGQTCTVSTDAPNPSEISVVFNGTKVPAQKNASGQYFFTNVVWQQKSSISVVVNGVTYKGRGA